MNCPKPIFRESAGGLVSCGRCHQCREVKKAQKMTRLILEGKKHEHVLFVTLTYNDTFLPRDVFCPVTGVVLYSHPFGCLDKRHLQLFNKRLLKKFPPRTVRYWCVGEYGEKRWRPHYHGIYWGIPFKKRQAFYDCWTDPVTKEPYCDPRRLTVEPPRDEWDVGRYVSSYIQKGLTSSSDYKQEGFTGKSNAERLEGRPPEFANVVSKGVGLGFVEDYCRAMASASALRYIADYRDIPRTILIDGKKMPLDRYMREKIIEKLSIKEMASETAQKKFAQEMSDLCLRAQKNEKVPKVWLGDPVREGWALEKQAEIERAAQLVLKERKGAFFSRKKVETLDA